MTPVFIIGAIVLGSVVFALVIASGGARTPEQMGVLIRDRLLTHEGRETLDHLSTLGTRKEVTNGVLHLLEYFPFVHISPAYPEAHPSNWPGPDGDSHL